MTKLEMAIEIASALLNADVDENNWKVKLLMKGTKAGLSRHIALAIEINLDRNSIIKDIS
jgi:hypothetical protein